MGEIKREYTILFVKLEKKIPVRRRKCSFKEHNKIELN
jgi:hypothetical protein